MHTIRMSGMQVRRLDAAALTKHQEAVTLHKKTNPNRSGRRKKVEQVFITCRSDTPSL